MRLNVPDPPEGFRALAGVVEGRDARRLSTLTAHDGRVDRFDLVAVAQARAGVGDDKVARRQTLCDLGIGIRMEADLHAARLDDVIMDDLHVRSSGSVGNGRTGNR